MSTLTLRAPLSGWAMPLAEVPDPVFAGGMMGEGVAIDPTDESTIYAGTGEANYANHSRYGLGVLKSTDAGETWSLLAGPTFAGRTFSRIVVEKRWES